MYAEVLKLVERVRHELQPIDAKILNHSYLQALQDGRIERERLRLFAAQQAYIIGSDLRSVALMVARASSEGSRAFFLELLEGERAALNALESFTAAVSGPAATAGAEEPLPGAFAYCAFVAWLSLYASEAEFAGALLINLPVWGGQLRPDGGRAAKQLPAVRLGRRLLHAVCDSSAGLRRSSCGCGR